MPTRTINLEMTLSDSEPRAEEGSEPTVIRCDICGDESASVRRIALDGEYDRLLKPHQVQYACPPCSEKKERKRLGLERGSGRG